MIMYVAFGNNMDDIRKGAEVYDSPDIKDDFNYHKFALWFGKNFFDMVMVFKGKAIIVKAEQIREIEVEKS